jgi:predicted transcriptional regulator
MCPKSATVNTLAIMRNEIYAVQTITDQNEGAMDQQNHDLMTLTADIVAAHVANNSVSVNDLPLLIGKVHGALSDLRSPAAPAPEPETPFVSVKASIKPDFIICLGCGKRMKMLKRHINTEHGLSVAEYRVKWGLADDYPMVAPTYAITRRDLAIKIGLGRKRAPTKKRASAVK